jgi:acyl-homoserine lactone acylase PvdQ
MSRFAGKLAASVAAFLCVLGLNASLSYGQSAPDFSAPGQAYNVDPPGQYGGFPPFPSYATDQLILYDGLTPLFDQVTDADLPNYFKQNVFGLGNSPLKRTETVPGKPDLVIKRDQYEVPHIEAPTRADVMYGIGWVTAQDRTLLMDQVRGPGRIAALDVPGIAPLSVGQLNPFFPSQQTEDFIASQAQLLQDLGPEGQQVLDDIDNYIVGINAWRTSRGVSGALWTRNDVLAVAALFGGVFGKGGGDEARRSELLSALQDRLGRSQGLRVWNDLREQNDREAPVSIDGRFSQGHSTPNLKGNAILDADSLDTSAATNSATAQASQQSASNAVLVGKDRSATGHPFFVAGPQVGYGYPGTLYEFDAHGGGIDARGVSFPGSAPYVELGRGQDYSWSATSSGSDNIDIFVETLCNGDDTHYRFERECVEMETFNAGEIGFSHTPVTFKETVHGPVIGYATVDGRRVALSLARTTRGREAVSALGFADFNTNAVHDVDSFFDSANKIEFSFNWFYSDKDDIAMFSSGRLPNRHPQVDMGLPTDGTGKYEWRGFLSQQQHPHGITPRDDAITNWNNKPVFGWQAADDNWSFGSIHREQLLREALNQRITHTLGSTVAAMNRAATQDLRNAKVLRSIEAVLDTGSAPNARDQQMLDLLKAWRTAGSSRLDRDLDGKIDDPGAAILDAAWPRITDAVMRPVLGPLVDRLERLVPRDQAPNPRGSSYNTGWYGYVDRDLRTLLGRPVSQPFATRFCGGGDLAACRASLWAALEAAGDELTTAQGPNPSAWRADATGERIRFSGFLPNTMRWSNRPTFQQVMSFRSHRPRR